MSARLYILLPLLAFLLSCSSDPKPQPQPKQQTETVYVTLTGEQYHRATCQYLSKSKIEILKEDANGAGYTACSKCRP